MLVISYENSMVPRAASGNLASSPSSYLINFSFFRASPILRLLPTKRHRNIHEFSNRFRNHTDPYAHASSPVSVLAWGFSLHPPSQAIRISSNSDTALQDKRKGKTFTSFSFPVPTDTSLFGGSQNLNYQQDPQQL